MKKVKNKRKSERGSVTLFVLVTMMLFTVILFLNYANQAEKIGNQKKQIEEIQRAYDAEENMEEIYDRVKNNLP